MEKINTDQQQQYGIAIGYCSCGVAYPSRVQRGGNCEARRRQQRANRECLRDERVVSRTLARALNLGQGGSAPRTLETAGKLQVLRNFSIPSVGKEKPNLSRKDNPLYVGLQFPTHRVECENGKEKKKEENDLGEKQEKKIKIRKVEV